MLYHQVKHAFRGRRHDTGMGETIGQRIQKRRLALHLTLEALGHAIGVTKSAVHQWEQDGTNLIGQNLVACAKALGVTESWIITGSGPMEAPSATSHLQPGQPVPLIDEVAAGAWSDVAAPYPKGGRLRTLYTSYPVGRGSFALRITGGSMEPDFNEGDEIIVDPSVTPHTGDIVVAKLENQESATIKKYRPRGEGPGGDQIIELVALNDAFASLRIDPQSPGYIVGVVVEHRRRLR